jgi:hypothetical protein
MFVLACELENRTDQPITVHLTMRGSPDPVINVIDPNQGLGVFQPVDGSTVKIAIMPTDQDKATGGE